VKLLDANKVQPCSWVSKAGPCARIHIGAT
jgi:hypothetical protein